MEEHNEYMVYGNILSSISSLNKAVVAGAAGPENGIRRRPLFSPAASVALTCDLILSHPQNAN